MAQKKAPKKRQSRKRLYILSGVLVCAAILLLAILQDQFSIFTPKPKPQPVQVRNYPQPTAGPTHTPTPTPSPQTFTSSDLGISFNYLQDLGRQKFFSKELGNKIFLYWLPGINQEFTGTDDDFLKTVAPGSKYVEVFSKDPQDSIDTAIQKMILRGYSQRDCQLTSTREGTNPDYQYREIKIPHTPGETFPELDAKASKCPGPYTMMGTNGVSYFAMDTKHPDKLLFFSIGQDNLPSGVYGGGTWDMTIKVLQ